MWNIFSRINHWMHSKCKRKVPKLWNLQSKWNKRKTKRMMNFSSQQWKRKKKLNTFLYAWSSMTSKYQQHLIFFVLCSFNTLHIWWCISLYFSTTDRGIVWRRCRRRKKNYEMKWESNISWEKWIIFANSALQSKKIELLKFVHFCCWWGELSIMWIRMK